MPTIPKGDTMSDYTIDTADICKHCPYIIREGGEVLGCACDLGLFCEYAPYEE